MTDYCNSYPPSTAAANKKLYPQIVPQLTSHGPTSKANGPTTPVAVHLYQPGPQKYGGTSDTTTTYGANDVKAPVVPKINILPKKPNNYRTYSIFVMLCSCFLCGLVALLYSVKVDRAYKRGDIATACRASETARKWNIAGVMCGVMDFIVMAAIWLAISYGIWKAQQ